MNQIANHLDGDMAVHIKNSVEHWNTEEDSAAEFDERIARSGLFERSFAEVNGFYLAHRPGREDKAARIDRVLIPGPKLRERGWTMTIGIEIKKSGCDFGAAVSQAIDYTYCTWNVGNYWMYCERIFLWPFAMPIGPLKSVMLQNGVGVVYGKHHDHSSEWHRPLIFELERQLITLLPNGDLDVCEPTISGHKKGSR